MYRQIPAALAAAFLLSGCGIMQTSEELVQSTGLAPSSQILLDNTAVEVEVSPPKRKLDGRRHTDDYFDLLAKAAASKTKKKAISKRASGEPANRATTKRNGDQYAELAMFDTVYRATDSVSPDKPSVDAEPLPGKPSVDAKPLPDKPSVDAEPLSASTDHPAENAIFFAFGSNELNMNGRVLLDNFVEQLNSSDLIQLTGYTCNIGSDHVNQNLSRNRAQMVKAYLTYRGVNASRIVTEGKGKKNPAASNNDKTTRMINRRVEIRVSR